MTWTQAQQLVNALNIIVAQSEYLTSTQYTAIDAIRQVLDEAGFETKYQYDRTYKIAAQITAVL